MSLILLIIYGKCSKILNIICLPKKLRQQVVTQLRLLLKKQSGQGFFDKHFVSSGLGNQHFLRTEGEKCLKFFRTFTIL